MGGRNKQNEGDENTLKASMTRKLKNLSKVSSHSFIYRVPRVHNWKDDYIYTPKLVSIGPFHRGKENLEAMEDHKWRYLNQFLSRDPSNDIDYYIQSLKSFEGKIRKCYGEHIKLSSDEFVEMMLLDGCFIIELILKFCLAGDSENIDDPIFGTIWMLNAIRLDMALLENQLPFCVLEHLFNVINGPNQQYSQVSLLQLTISFCQYNVLGYEISDRDSGDVKHLVHLLQKDFVLLNERIPPLNKGVVECIPSATELHDAGVMFQVVKSCSFLDVTFVDGVFKIPRISIGQASRIVIPNIIAFENFDRRPNIISQYIKLMDNLINTAEDVALLLERGIISNWFGDNKDLASLFNRFGDGAVVHAHSFHYARLYEDVNEYYKKPWPRAMKKYQDYFNAPWSFMASTAAVILLLCTIVQTICSLISL